MWWARGWQVSYLVPVTGLVPPIFTKVNSICSFFSASASLKDEALPKEGLVYFWRKKYAHPRACFLYIFYKQKQLLWLSICFFELRNSSRISTTLQGKNLQVYLGRDKLAMFTITVYVNIIVYMYLYIDVRAQVFSAIWHLDRCSAGSSLS